MPPTKEPKIANVVNITEAKAHFSELLKRAAKGEQIIIAKAGKPLARLVPFERSSGKRKGGRWKGRVHIADDFDDPLPGEIGRAFGDPRL